MKIIIPIIMFFISSYSIPHKEVYIKANNNSKYTIYLVKYRWHTGIVFNKKSIDTVIWPEANDFKNYKFLDIGWGDRDFYIHNGFDPGLAVKALFYPTPSVLRIEGLDFAVEDYIKFSDAAFKIKLDSTGFKNLLSFIHNTYKHTQKGKQEIISVRANGMIKYYKAKGEYSIFNTCNTWVAKGLNRAGLKISSNIILTQQLFKELYNIQKN